MWFEHGVDDVSLTISHHMRAPNSGGRTPGSQTPGGVPGWTEPKNGVTTAISPLPTATVRTLSMS